MIIYSLAEMIDGIGEEATKRLLSSFSVSRNKDVEHFIQDLAIAYEKSSNARTFIFMSEEKKALGFVSLSLTAVSIPSTVNSSLKKKIRGFGRSQAPYVPCYLIGQIARLDGVPKEMLPGDCLFDSVMSFVSVSRNLFGGRCVAIDCSDELVDYYKNRHFSLLGKTGSLNQMLICL